MRRKIVLIFLSNIFWMTLGLSQGNSVATDHYNKAAEYFNSKNFGLAIASYSAFLELEPDNVKAYYNRGTASLNLQQNDAAIKDFRKVISLDPAHAKGHLSLGYTLLSAGNHEEAIGFLTKAAELDPTLSKAFVQRGTAYMKTNKYNEAIADFTRAITMGEQSYALFLNRSICKNKTEDFMGALADYTAAGNLKPDQGVTSGEKAKIYLKQNKWHEAISETSTAMRYNAGDADLYYYRGYAKIMLEDVAGALTDLNICLQIKPG